MGQDALLTAAEGGASVVTATQRLARALGYAYAERRRATGARAWPTPRILPWSGWLQRCWQDAAAGGDRRLLLGAARERAIWQGIVDAPERAGGLLQARRTAQEVRAAWQLVQQWRIDLDDPELRYTDEGEAFVGWARAFDERCRAREWLDAARLPDALIEHWAAGVCPVPERLILAGFDELTPQHDSVRRRLRELGCQVEVAEPPPSTGQGVRSVAADARAELDAAARWARARLDDNPAARIGVVVPDLAGRREAVARALDAALVPGAVSDPPGPERPYNLSLGPPLSQYGAVDTALAAIELATGRTALERVGTVLRSPFVAGADTEAEARALLDARLRDLGELEVEAGAVLSRAADCPQLARGLEALRDAVRAAPSRAGPAVWASRFADWLRALGWPASAALDSETYQAVQAWQDLLGALAEQDLVRGSVASAEALAELRSLAAETPFQPQTVGERPVQVLGALEAAGMRFDHLWVAGLDDTSWPPVPRPNPFLPIGLQRRHGLPHASAERELDFVRRVTERLRGAADEVVMSWPALAGETELRPSPLIADLPLAGEADLTGGGVDPYAELLCRAGRLEWLDDYRAPPLPSGAELPGGAAAFRDQAACPFRAFVSHRLAARPLSVAAVGLDPATRGTLVHRLLQRIWSRLGDLEALLAMSSDQRAETIDHAVDEALAEVARKRPGTVTRRFRALEDERLRTLIAAWLAGEAERPPFRCVETEAERHFELAGLKVRGRIDRVDVTGDGRRLLIDYKTGEVNVGDWLGSRPDEPQLPLYLAAEDRHVDGLAFASLKPGKLGFRGIADGDDPPAAGIEPVGASRAREYGDWDALVAHWRSAVTALAEELAAGEARVDPKRGPQTCRFCHLHAVCRIGELTEMESAPRAEVEGD